MSEDVVVVDDTLLALHLAGRRHWLPAKTVVATTTSWWFRVAKAIERQAGGSLSTLISTFEEDDRRTVENLIRRLPDDILVLHPRDTVPLAAAVAAEHGLNLLAADAVAAAVALSGRILVDVRDDGPRLRSVAAGLGVPYEVIEP